MSATSAGALALSMIAEDEASDAKKISCRAFMRDYKDFSATIESKQQYSQCVELIYPKDSDSSVLVGALLFIAVGAAVYFLVKYLVE